jgi:hypothetical protein
MTKRCSSFALLVSGFKRGGNVKVATYVTEMDYRGYHFDSQPGSPHELLV